MTDERYQTGSVMMVLGAIATWAIDNPTEFVTMTVTIGGFIIMLVKFLEERRQKKELHDLNMKLLQKQIDES